MCEIECQLFRYITSLKFYWEIKIFLCLNRYFIFLSIFSGIWHGDQFLQNTFDLDLLGPIKSEPIVTEVLDIVEHHPTTTDAFQPVRAPRGQPSFKCPNCCRLYMRISCLKRHLRMECGKAPNYECRVCHGKFTYKHNLMAHMKLHVEDPKYKCAYCNKKFYRHDKLVKHMETHKSYDGSI